MSNNLKLIEPTFSSPLTDLIIELDHLRRKRLGGSTHPKVFFQLKHIFHSLESIGSARIEGNNTTVEEYIETKIEPEKINLRPNIKEIHNIENAMGFIEEHIKNSDINRAFISELHKKIVNGLALPPQGEGDPTPGEYRKKNVKIAQSQHIPPDSLLINDYMNDLFTFINTQDSPKYDLLKAAMAHHRFVWIHPFSNGNGRTVRLFTYAMLVKLGFNVSGRILNPTAIFCNNRNHYYTALALADQGTDNEILSWCEYVLKGLKEEIEKIDKLLNYDFLSKEILLPTIDYSIERKYITILEARILKLAINKQIIQANDLQDIFKNKLKSEISRQIRKLIDKKMLMPEDLNKRKYLLCFENNYLLRGIIKYLGINGFLPADKEPN